MESWTRTLADVLQSGSEPPSPKLPGTRALPVLELGLLGDGTGDGMVVTKAQVPRLVCRWHASYLKSQRRHHHHHGTFLRSGSVS